MIGLYRPGTSPLHRCPAAVKLVLLAAVLAGVGVVRTLPVVTAAALLAVGLTALSRVGFTVAAAQVRPVLPIAVVVCAARWWWADAASAAATGLWLLAAVLLAALVTLTTPTGELLATIERGLSPLRLLGVDPARIGLVLALAIRSVPVITDLASQVRDARRARGAERSWRAFAVPFLLRSVRHADLLGQALEARGVGDD